MKHFLFLYLVLCAERAHSAHKTKYRNKEFFTPRLQSTPNGNQSLGCACFGCDVFQRVRVALWTAMITKHVKVHERS